jgi:hypothetical protein
LEVIHLKPFPDIGFWSTLWSARKSDLENFWIESEVLIRSLFWIIMIMKKDENFWRGTDARVFLPLLPSDFPCSFLFFIILFSCTRETDGLHLLTNSNFFFVWWDKDVARKPYC